MTREELEKRIVQAKKTKEWISGEVAENIKEIEKVIADWEKQLAELEVEMYKPFWSVPNPLIHEEVRWAKRHNAGEELKKLISEENKRQGWKVDWNLDQQKKYFIIGYDYVDKDIEVHWDNTFQAQENELYFSEQSSKNEEFLNKIKSWWLKWKGIE